MRKKITVFLLSLVLMIGSGAMIAMAETPDPNVTSITGISEVTDNTGGDGNVWLEFKVKFDQNLSNKQYSKLNGRILLGPDLGSGATTEKEVIELETWLGNPVKDHIRINGKPIRDIFTAFEASVPGILPESLFDMDLNVDDRLDTMHVIMKTKGSAGGNAGTYFKDFLGYDATTRRIASGTTFTITDGFMSGFINKPTNKYQTFSYDAEANAWNELETPITDVSIGVSRTENDGMKNILDVRADVALGADTYTGVLDQAFLQDYFEINGKTQPDYFAEKGFRVDLNQTKTNFNFWLNTVTGGADYNVGDTILLKKGMGISPSQGSATRKSNYALQDNYFFWRTADKWEYTIVSDTLKVMHYSAPEIGEGADSTTSFDIAFNHPLVEKPANGTNTVENALTLDWIKNGVLINDKTIASMNETSSIVAAKIAGNKLTLTIKNSSLKLDNTDKIEVSADLESEFTGKVSEGYHLFLCKTYSDWLAFPITEEIPDAVGEVSVVNMSRVRTADGNPGFVIEFDKDITYKTLNHYNGDIPWLEGANLGYNATDILRAMLQPAHDGLLKGVSFTYTVVGGTETITKTVEELMAMTAEGHDKNVLLMIHYNGNKMTINWQGSYAETVVDYAKPIKIMIDKDIFVTPNGGKFKKASDTDTAFAKIYHDEYMNWFDVNQTPAWTNFSAESIRDLHESDTHWTFNIHFNRSIENFVLDNIQNEDYIKNAFRINNVLVADILANAKDAKGNAVADPISIGTRRANAGDPNSLIMLQIAIKKSVTYETGGIDGKFKEANFVTIMGDSKFPSLCKTTETQRFKYREYKQDYTYWYEEVSKADWETISLVSVGAPTKRPDGDVAFTLTFDKDISSTEMLHLNADIGWLEGVSSQPNAPFSYDSAQMAMFKNYGILDSVRDNIKFNGKTIMELMMNEKDPSQRVVTVAVHMGQPAPDSVSIVFKDTVDNADGVRPGANKITDLNQNFIISVKAGFSTFEQQMTAEDKTFVYNPSTKKFVDEGAWSDNTKVKEVFYNGVAVVIDGTITVKTDKFDAALLSIKTDDETATVKPIQSSTLKEGNNVIKFTVVSSGGVEKEYSFTINYEQEKKGCGSSMDVVTGIGAVLVLLALAGVSVLFYRKKNGGKA